MRRFWLIVILILLAGGIFVCAIRWKAWFRNPPEPAWTGDTIDYHFHTFGAGHVPGFEHDGLYWRDVYNPDTLEILLFGDVHNAMTHADWQAVADRHPNADCYAQLGDFVERGYFYYNQQLYHNLQGTGFDTLPIINVPGNHEYRKGLQPQLPDYWRQTFRHPHNGPEESKGTTYYIDFPNLRLIALDTQGLQHLYEYTRVNTWLKRVIKSANDRFVIVIMHHPVFSTGKGRFNPGTFAAFVRPLSEADLVFAGHDHNYERRLPFVNTSSTTKTKRRKLSQDSVSALTGVPLYEDIRIYNDTLFLQTRICDSGAVCDSVVITRSVK